MKAPLVALLFSLVGCWQLSEEAREDERKEKPRAESKRRAREEPNVEVSSELPRAQTRGRDQSGGHVNAPATGLAYSPRFVMRGFSGGSDAFRRT